MLRFRVKLRPRKLSKSEGVGAGPEGRLKRLRKHVTALIRHERIETTLQQCDETRGYAEKLIQMAVRNGDTHKHTMEMADNWLLEKDLIHKLFKVLVPRYSSFPAAATSIHRISGTYPGNGTPLGVLELKGNPWPSVRPKPRDTSLLLHNILLHQAKQDYHAQRHKAEAAASSTTAAPAAAAATEMSAASGDGSSVDGDLGSSVDEEPPSKKVGDPEMKGGM